MHIAEFNDSFPPQTDGVAQTVRNYAYWLNRKHGECCVVTPKFPKAHDSEEFSVIRFVSIPTFVDKDYNVGLPEIAFKTSKRLETMPLDLVHAHSPFPSGSLALMTARKKEIPIVATFHSKFADDFAQRLKMENAGKIVARYVAKFFSQVDEAWAVNASTGRTLQEYGYRGPVKVMPNGCDFAPTERTEANRRSVLKAFAFEDKPTLLFVGRLVEQKNISLILKSLNLLRQSHDFNAILVGDGEGAEGYKKQAMELGLGDAVRFPGTIRDRNKLRGIYAASDVFMLPSVYDNAPLVVREAASCGCPSLLITGSNSAEGIQDGVNGFTCELGDAAFAAALGAILANPGLIRAAGEAARDTVYIPWEKVIGLVAEEYKRVIFEYKEKKTAGSAHKRYYSIPVVIAREILSKQAVRLKFATRSADRRAKERRVLIQKKNLKKFREIRTRLTENVRKRSL
jgi:glycosyltransferase involved in cell wall biosynthesis